MAIDASELARFTAAAIDNLEDHYAERDATLGDVIVISEIRYQTDDGEEATSIRYASTDPRIHVQIGLLRSALLSAEQ
jgi:hypothetical protein